MGTAARMATERISPTHRADFAREVREGLDRAGQKELPSKYLYDEIGSALFEVICLLPEYGLSRAGERLMERYSEEMIDLLPVMISTVTAMPGISFTVRSSIFISVALRAMCVS